MESRVFRWSCFGVAVVALVVFGWMVNDVRGEVKRTNELVTRHLPQIIDNVRTGTETLASVARDIDGLRDLAGIAGGPNDPSLIRYADAVLDFLEQLPGQIGLEKVVGSDMKDLISARAWVADSRKEALWLTVRADTPAELVDRLAHNKFGSAYYYVGPDGARIALAELIRSKVPPPP
jgi:hypothetical protein